MAQKKSTAKPAKTVKQQRIENPHKSFRITRKRDMQKTAVKLPSIWQLFKDTVALLRKDIKLFGGLTVIYLVLAWFINGLPSQGEYLGLKSIFDGASAAAGFGAVILGAFAGAFTDADSDIQQFLATAATIIFLLCFIWVARKRLAGTAVTIREALYNAPAPLVSFLLTGVMVAIHLLPGIFGSLILSYAFGLQGGSRSGAEAMIFTVAGLLLLLLSTYLLLHSILATVIVTLPNMYPIEALRSAKKLVYGRRLQVLIRLFGMILIALAIWLVGLSPFVLLDFALNIDALPLVPFAASILGAVTLPFTTVYLYRLYRYLL